MIRKTMLASLAILTLSGCATFSFAPPPVNLEKRVTSSNSTSCTTVSTEDAVNDHNSVESTLYLIDNYVQAYGCAMATTSNGRQMFQIPSHLAALLGVAGAAFGGGRDLALGSGIAAATFNSGNGYWAPQDKAVVIDSAYDAVLCIRTEAVGIDFIDATKSAPQAIRDGNGGNAVSIDARWRYFGLISAALRQVDRIAASRLRSIGKFDPAGLVAEIEALNKQVDAAQKAKDAGTGDSAPAASPSPAATDSPAGIAAADDDGGGQNHAKGQKVKLDTNQYPLDLALLQPKIQRCVVRAKM